MSASQLFSGNGDPNGIVDGNPGDLYQDQTGKLWLNTVAPSTWVQFANGGTQYVFVWQPGGVDVAPNQFTNLLALCTAAQAIQGQKIIEIDDSAQAPIVGASTPDGTYDFTDCLVMAPQGRGRANPVIWQFTEAPEFTGWRSVGPGLQIEMGESTPLISDMTAGERFVFTECNVLVSDAAPFITTAAGIQILVNQSTLNGTPAAPVIAADTVTGIVNSPSGMNADAVVANAFTVIVDYPDQVQIQTGVASGSQQIRSDTIPLYGIADSTHSANFTAEIGLVNTGTGGLPRVVTLDPATDVNDGTLIVVRATNEQLTITPTGADTINGVNSSYIITKNEALTLIRIPRVQGNGWWVIGDTNAGFDRVIANGVGHTDSAPGTPLSINIINQITLAAEEVGFVVTPDSTIYTGLTLRVRLLTGGGAGTLNIGSDDGINGVTGDTAYTMVNDFEVVELYADGANGWYVMSTFGAP